MSAENRPLSCRPTLATTSFAMSVHSCVASPIGSPEAQTALEEAGFLPVGARLLATAAGPAAMMFYDDRQGDTISFYLRPPSAAGPLRRGHRQDGHLVAEYGSENGYSYAVVSDAVSQEIVRNALRTLD
jgi:hypothetical protein